MYLNEYELDLWWDALMRRIGRGVPTSRQEAGMTLAECEKALAECEKALEEIPEAEAPPLTAEEIDRIVERVTGEKQ